MKRALLLCAFLLCCAPAFAQLTVTFAWDASVTPSPADNPIKYRLYMSANSDLSAPTVTETGQALETAKGLAVGRVWVWATCYYNAIVDGTPTGPIIESDKSNILAIEVFAPPGRPDKARIKSVTIIGSLSGKEVKVKQAE